jgi:beta-lactamase regulating signal transducer with metallopeptidase domain
MLHAVFRTILEMSLAASVVIIVIILFRQAFGKKLPRIFSYALWAMVLVRLLFPLSLPSVFSIFNLMPASEAIFTQGSVLSDQTKIASPEMSALPGITPYGNTASYPTGKPSLPAVSDKQTIPEMRASQESTGASKSDTKTNGRLLHTSALIWLIVASGLLLLGASAYIRASRRFREAVLYNNEALVSGSHHLLGLKRRIQVYVSGSAPAPVVCGLVKPRIILPKNLPESCRDSELQQILVHELVHIQRFDYLVKPIWSLALCMHWFNPLVWAAFYLYQKDMELACDEKVISLYEHDIRSEYATVLIRLATRQNMLLSGGLPSFGESNIKSRIKSIMTFSKTRVRLGAAAIVLFAIIGAVVLTNGQSGATDDHTGNDKASVDQNTAVGSSLSPSDASSPQAGTQDETAAQVEKLLDKILQGGPQFSSNPYDYVKGSADFAKLTAIGEPALSVMLVSFGRSNADGLREYIMAAASATILGVYNDKTGIGTSSGREWFYKYGTFAQDGNLREIDADYTAFQNTSNSAPFRLPARTNAANLDDVISDSILLANREAFKPGEKAVEAHKILGTEEKEGLIHVYVQTSFHWFGFEDGVFTPVSGGGIEPVIIKLKKHDNGNYEVMEYNRLLDVKKGNNPLLAQFPDELAAAITDNDKSEQTSKELWEEQIIKAGSYLKEIGRSDASVASSISRDLTDRDGLQAVGRAAMLKHEFPNWKGSREILVSTGGKSPGTTVRCTLQSEYEKTAAGEYLVTLTKKWDISINGSQPVSYWKYKVSGEQVELVEEQYQDDKIRLMK